VTSLFHSASQPPDDATVDKGHGRLEVREIRVSTELVGYSPWPSLGQVAEVRATITHLKTGEVRQQSHYLVTSLTPDQATPNQLLQMHRTHWRIENRLFHVKDNSFGEDRHVLLRRSSGTNLSLLRNAALTLLDGSSRVWGPTDYKPARSQYLSARPLAALTRKPSS